MKLKPRVSFSFNVSIQHWALEPLTIKQSSYFKSAYLIFQFDRSFNKVECYNS